MGDDPFREKNKEVRWAGFLAFWLSKFLFSEFPGYGVKSSFFLLAIKLARGTQYPLAPLFLGHVYSQLDQLHGGPPSLQCLTPREEFLLLTAMLATRVEYRSLLLIMLALVQLGKPLVLVFPMLQHPIDAYPYPLLGFFPLP